VALRLRGVLGDLRRDHEGGRVLLFGHEAVVYLLRYLLEGLTEADLLKIARDAALANCSITSWVRRGGAPGMSVVAFNSVDHLKREGAEPTHEEEIRAEPV
jgi:broad specificity phosphatase PhoE